MTRILGWSADWAAGELAKQFKITATAGNQMLQKARIPNQQGGAEGAAGAAQYRKLVTEKAVEKDTRGWERGAGGSKAWRGEVEVGKRAGMMESRYDTAHGKQADYLHMSTYGCMQTSWVVE